MSTAPRLTVPASEIRPPAVVARRGPNRTYLLRTPSGFEYELDRDRIPDARRLCRWLHHCAGKTWFGPAHVRQLLDLARADGLWDYA